MTSVESIIDFSLSHEPVFIVGMERGGTSIIYQTLSTASVFSGFKGEQETFIFDSPETVMTAAARDMTRSYIGGEASLEEYRRWFGNLTGWPENWMLPRRIATSYFYFVHQKGLTARIIEKTPRHALKLDLMMRCFPKARIIGVHRHPLGIIESYRSRLAREIELGLSATSYAWLDRTPDQICAHIEKIAISMTVGLQKYPRNMMVISYEELLRDPEFSVGAMSAFTGLQDVTVQVKTENSAKAKSADPLLRAGGIVTGNEFSSQLSLADKLGLLARYPDLFAIAAGIKTSRP